MLKTYLYIILPVFLSCLASCTRQGSFSVQHQVPPKPEKVELISVTGDIVVPNTISAGYLPVQTGFSPKFAGLQISTQLVSPSFQHVNYMLDSAAGTAPFTNRLGVKCRMAVPGIYMCNLKATTPSGDTQLLDIPVTINKTTAEDCAAFVYQALDAPYGPFYAYKTLGQNIQLAFDSVGEKLYVKSIPIEQLSQQDMAVYTYAGGPPEIVVNYDCNYRTIGVPKATVLVHNNGNVLQYTVIGYGTIDPKTGNFSIELTFGRVGAHSVKHVLSGKLIF